MPEKNEAIVPTPASTLNSAKPFTLVLLSLSKK
jgi:hypothetical protein